MAISYEEALETLNSMFGPPWTQETLDAVLRHHNGHMENTVDTVLRHGDGDPQALIQQLKSGLTDSSNDEALARQLAQEERSRGRRGAGGRTLAPPAPTPAVTRPPEPKGRGTPTTLPADFLRIPGQATTSAAASTPTMDQDEALARMLQDELFSQELANNPEFAHLARPRMVGGRPVRSSTRRVGELPSRRTMSGSSGGPPRSPGGEEGPKIMEKISELGETAKKRLQILAAQFNQNRTGGASGAAAGSRGQAMATQEQRGLLDGDGDDGEEMELTFSRTADSKKSM